MCSEELLTTAGSILYSDSKSLSRNTKNGEITDDAMRAIYREYAKLALDGLIYIGGDGSITLMNRLVEGNPDLRTVAVPKTIDRDVAFTDLTIGFLTAVQIVSDAIENVRTTAKSHERTMVLEVMGRDAGFIAMYAGIASGADVILVPEFKYSIGEVKQKITSCYAAGKDHCVVVVAEAVETHELRHQDSAANGSTSGYPNVRYKGIGQHLSDVLRAQGFDSRAVRLGHTQRGGKTSIYDRIIGSAFGVEAVNALYAHDFGKMVCYVDGHVERVPVKDIVAHINKKLDARNVCVKTALDLGVYIGEVHID
jgi:6-phosphofructokinase 1